MAPIAIELNGKVYKVQKIDWVRFVIKGCNLSIKTVTSNTSFEYRDSSAINLSSV